MRTTKIILAAVALTLFVAALASLGGFSADPARAAEGDNVSGFAWSDNIGWISFYGNNYGVDINDDPASPSYGAFSGYAWSDATGWINFAPDASNAPENPKTAVRVDFGAAGDLKPVTGWARACSVFQIGCDGTLKNAPDGSDIYRGGWDGWIKMSDSSWDPDGVTLDTATNKFEGYAWGSDVVGWISMSGTSPDYAVVYGGTPVAPPATPTVTLSAPASVAEGGTADIEWTVRDAALGCGGSDNNPNDTTTDWWSERSGALVGGNGGGPGVTIPVGPINGTVTYTLDCGDPPDGEKSVTINVNPFINYFRVNGISSDTIFIGEQAALSWEVANTVAGDSCEINHGVGVADISSCDGRLCGGSTTISPISDTTYTLSCPNVVDDASVTVYAHPLGFFLKAKNDENKIRIISIGRIGGSAVGTGGISTKTIIEIHGDPSFTDTVNFSITDAGHPFLSAVPAIPKSIYKFRSVPLAEGGCGATVLEGNGATGINVSSSYFWNNDCGIEFWVETATPLPPLSNSEIIITGTDTNSTNGTAAPDNLSIFLDSRLFDPEYREI